jgi:BolA protein
VSGASLGTGITAAAIEQRLRELLAPTRLEVLDESVAHAGHAGTHVRVRIATPHFEGLPRVARHRLVYDAVQEFIDQGLHALAIETF